MRHLGAYQAHIECSDIVWAARGVGGVQAEDALALSAIEHGCRVEDLASRPTLLTVTNVNDAPQLATGAVTSITAEEFSAVSVDVSKAFTDVDVGDALRYSLTDSAGGRFAIDATTGVLTVADGSLLNYEAAASHNITVRVTDSGTNHDANYCIIGEQHTVDAGSGGWHVTYTLLQTNRELFTLLDVNSTNQLDATARLGL